jgi:internalin A
VPGRDGLRALLTLGRLRELDLSVTKVSRLSSDDSFGPAFPVLESLSLRACRAFKDARQLSGLQRLTRLDLGHTGIRDLAGVRDLPALTHLDLRDCAQLRGLAGIDALTALTDLVLDNCPRLSSLQGLGAHPRLTQLTVAKCPELRDLVGLSPLAGLTELVIKQCERLTSVRGVGALRTLTTFSVTLCPALEDYAELSSLPSLSHLKLHGLEQLRDLSPFDTVPGLRQLDIWHCPALTDLETLGEHGQLTRLAVGVCDNLRTPGRLTGLPALRELEFNCRAMTGLGGLGNLPSLRKLVVISGTLESIDPVAGTPLVEVALYGVDGLRSLRALEHCPDLRELTVHRCVHVEELPVGTPGTLSLAFLDWKDLSPLTGHDGIRTLHLNSMNALYDLSALTTLPALTHLSFNTVSGPENFEILLELPALERLTMPGGLHRRRGLYDTVVDQLAGRGVAVAHG